VYRRLGDDLRRQIELFDDELARDDGGGLTASDAGS
jgi:hypothetical protein